MSEQTENTPEKEITDTDIAVAVDSLNHKDDAHWTKDGEPDLNVLKEKLGKSVDREAVDKATLKFRRIKPKKKATMTFIVDADVNQNEFKNWLKSCPFSFEGGQTIAWENVE